MHAGRIGRKPLCNTVIAQRDDTRREQRGVHGTADRHRRDRNAGRHLHDRKQRVESPDARPLDRNADNGNQCFCSSHAR